MRVVAAAAAAKPLLEVEDLRTYFFTRDGVVRAVDGVSISVAEGETLAIVGESGCGKSVTSLSILRLIQTPPGRIVSSSIRFQGVDLLDLDAAMQRSLSGLTREPMRKTGAAMVLITLVFGVDDEMAQRVVVMYAGRKVEEARVGELCRQPLHPYTLGLLTSVPKLGATLTQTVPERLTEIPGTVPSLRDEIKGCPFAPRCTFASERCHVEAPPLEIKTPAHLAACFHSDRIVR